MVNSLWEDFESPTPVQAPFKTPEMMLQEQPQEEDEAPEPSWGSFKTPMEYQAEEIPEEEDATGWMVRNLVSTGSRVGEQFLGRLGNTEKFMKDLMVNFPKESTGPFGWAIRELIGPERWEQMVRGKSGQETLLPTSEQYKEASEKITGGYTKPKTKSEKRFQEGIEDLSATIFGSRTPGRRIQQAARIGAPVLANVAKGVVEDLGFGEDAANKAKMGIWLGLNLAGNINGKRYASELMNQGRQGIPENARFNIQSLENRLDNLLRDPQILSADPRSALARQQIEAIRRDLANGQVDVRSLMNTYDGINATKRSRDMFSLNRSDQNFARRQIDKVRNAVRDEIMDSARQYPDALQAWQNGIRAWSTIHQSQAVTNFVENLSKGPYGKMLVGPTAALFGMSTHATKMAPWIKGVGAGALPATYKTGQILYRIYNNQDLARYYFNAIREANQQNAAGFMKNYNMLKKGLEKDSTENPPSK